MRRIRSIFLLAALLLVFPCAYLVRTTHQGLDQADRDAFRRIANARIDRMEEELVGLLEREDLRSIADYTALRAPQGLVGGVEVLESSLQRSPLADPPPRAEVVGWFQINPDGTLVTPHPVEGAAAGESDLRRITELREVHAWYLQHHLTSEQVLPEARPFMRDVQVARVLSPLGNYSGKEARSFSGKGGDTWRRPSTTDPSPQKQPPGAEAVARPPARYPAGEDPLAITHFIDANRAGPPLLAPVASQPTLAQPGTATQVHERILAGELRLEVDPVRILPMDSTRLIGIRRVWVDGQQYRQLFVLRVAPLMRRLAGLARRVPPTGGDSLFEITYDHGKSAQRMWLGALDGSSRFYAIRSFSRPFDCFRVRLDSSSVAGGFSRTTFWSVVGMLLGIGLLGVIAIDRALASLVETAERRQGFVSSVTHELKTPLTTIRMYGEMLRDGVVTEPDRQNEYHAAIASEGERLARLVDNVLDLARLEKGSYRFNPVTADVGEVVSSVAETMQVYAASLGFELSTEIAADLRPAILDRDALVQILINLVDNALKFSKDQEPKVVSLEAMNETDRVAILIKDHGPGISPRELGRVQRPFYRADDSLTRSTKGTGLGLSLVSRLAQGMGAQLTLSSRPGGGLIASVLLSKAGGATS